MRYLNQIIVQILLISVIGIQLSAQTVQIFDAETRTTLPFTLVYSPDGKFQKTADLEGKVLLPHDTPQDSLIIQQVGYEELIIEWPERDTNIYLSSKYLSLDEIVVSANRWEQKKSEISAYVQKVDPKAIELLQPQTTADLISGEGLVYVQKSQLGGGSPMIRGFSTNRVLLVVDGVRMNNAIFRSGNLQNIISIDPFIIEQAEVLFGPGSVIYGSDAIGGVMDFHTLKPRIKPGKEFSIGGKAQLRHSSANREFTGQLALSYGNDKWQGVTTFSYSDFGNLKMGRFGRDRYLRENYQARVNGRDTLLENPDPRIQRPTAYSQYNLMQKLNYVIKPGQKLETALIYTQTSDIPRYDRLIQMRDGQPRSAEWYYGPQKWNLTYAQFSSALPTSLYDHLNVRLSYQFFEESRNDRGWQKQWLRSRIEQVNVSSLNIDLDKHYGDLKLYYGIDATYNQVLSSAISRSIINEETQMISSRYPDGSDWLSSALYATGRWSVNEGTHINAGLRANYIYMHAPFDNVGFPLPVESAQLNFGNLSGSIGIISRIADGQQLFFNFSTGFRAPNIDDIGKVFDSEPGAVVVPNPDLRPEYAYSLDLGYTAVKEETFKLETSLFATWLDNAMVRRNFQFRGQDSILYDGELSRVQAVQNAATGFVLGGQVSMSYAFSEHWKANARISYQYGRSIEESGGEKIYEPLRHAAPLFGQTGLTYEQGSWRSSIIFDFNGQIKAKNMPPSEKGKPHLYALNEEGEPFSPAWYRLDWRLQKQWGPLSTTFSIQNITNQRYRPYSSGIVAPGLNFIFAAAYKF